MKGLLRQHLLQTFGFWIPDWVCEVLDWLCEFRIGFARFWIASSLVTLDWVCEVLDWFCERCGDVGSVGEGARERGSELSDNEGCQGFALVEQMMNWNLNYLGGGSVEAMATFYKVIVQSVLLYGSICLNSDPSDR